MTEADGMPVDLREIEAIKVLKARYLRLMDTRQWSQWRELLAEDVEAVYDGGDDAPDTVLARSAGEFVERMRSVLSDAVHVHLAYLPEIVLTSPTTATGIWAMSDTVRRADGEVGIMWGSYRDAYAKGADGRWTVASVRIARRLVVPLREAGLPEP